MQTAAAAAAVAVTAANRCDVATLQCLLWTYSTENTVPRKCGLVGREDEANSKFPLQEKRVGTAACRAG